MGFDERVHAFIAAKYYVRLTDRFGGRGRAAFIHAVQYYAGQRGRRMAQRAIRDGRALTHEAFVQYGELTASSKAEPASLSPDYELHITACPWHQQFKEMGCLEAGEAYCAHIDEALFRGFNPEIPFQALQNLNTSEYCVHRVAGAKYTAPPGGPVQEAHRRDFSYHCGHLYWAFNEVCAAIFGADGEAASAGVLADVAAEYGQAMADELVGWKHTNFNIC